jgi:hypothetical protein
MLAANPCLVSKRPYIMPTSKLHDQPSVAEASCNHGCTHAPNIYTVQTFMQTSVERQHCQAGINAAHSNAAAAAAAGAADIMLNALRCVAAAHYLPGVAASSFYRLLVRVHNHISCFSACQSLLLQLLL